MKIKIQPYGEAPAIAANKPIGHLRYVEGEPVIVITFNQCRSEGGQREIYEGTITLEGDLTTSLARMANPGTSLPAHPDVLLVPHQYMESLAPVVEEARKLLQGMPGEPTIEFPVTA